MAKPKQVRALKSSGVEPLAPTLIKRIQHTLVLKGEDRRWASEIGRLSMLGELTARQTLAAYHVGEIEKATVPARMPGSWWRRSGQAHTITSKRRP
jgi:hypothetical protein